MNAQIEALKSKLEAGQILAKDKDFASSLVSQFFKKGDLSPKQWPWVEKLAAVAAPKVVAESDMDRPGAPGVNAAFAAAVPADHKKPAVILAMGEEKTDGQLRLSKRPSYLRLQYRPRPGVEWTYAGLVTPEDEVSLGYALRHAYPALKADDFVGVLEDFANDVPGVLAHTGLVLGICANCGKTLTHPVSVKMGIGPVCVKQFPSLLPLWKATETALANIHPLA